MGGQGGCERSVCENSKKKLGGGGSGGGVGLGGVRVDVIEELKFLGKFTQKFFFFFLGGGGGGVGLVGEGGQGGCE